jgi:pseudouridine kinase
MPVTQRERELLRWIEENPLISQQELADKAGITRSCVAAHISNLMKKGYIAGKGYVLRSATYAAVVGAVNMDIGGQSTRPLVSGDSNPGRVRMSLGGVGRNIAHNMALLGVDTRLITAFGDDVYAQKIAASCGELGIDISQSLTVPGGATSTYLFLGGPDGDMALAVSDMEIYDHLTPAFLSSRLGYLNNAQLIVVDANLPEQTILWLAENAKVPLFADPVSTAKAPKLKEILGRLHTLKPNRLEAQLLSGVTITDRSSLDRAADVLLGTGLRRVFISLGGDGVYAADQAGGRLHLPCLPGKLINATGCGDAFMAALVWAYLEGTDLAGTARAGLAASSIAMEGAQTINPAMSVREVRRRLAE